MSSGEIFDQNSQPKILVHSSPPTGHPYQVMSSHSTSAHPRTQFCLQKLALISPPSFTKTSSYSPQIFLRFFCINALSPPPSHSIRLISIFFLLITHIPSKQRSSQSQIVIYSKLHRTRHLDAVCVQNRD